jgi:predicted porin
MKRPPQTLCLTSALIGTGLFLAAAQACAQDNVTVYGRAVMSVNQVVTGGAAVREVRDNASRLGFRGKEDLGGGASAFFGIEFTVSMDTGNPGLPTFRNNFVGLSGDWGALALGRLDSANPTGSPLYSQITNLTHFAPNDAGATATSTVMQNARNRTSNSIGYASPIWSGFGIRARHYLRGADTVAQPVDTARSTDLGFDYNQGDLKVAVGFAKDTRKGGLAANEFDSKWQAGLNYAVMPGLELYGLAGSDKFNKTVGSRGDVKYSIVGTAYTSGPHKVVFNYMERDVQTSLTGNRIRKQLSYQYFLSKRTDLQFFIDHDGIDSSKPNVQVRAVGFGVRHNF